MLNTIKNKLEELEGSIPIYYGMVDESQNDAVWDYIVFFRNKTTPNSSKTAYSYTFTVAIIKENYIPEGLEMSVVDKLLEIPGVKQAGDISFDYTKKGSTNTIVEVARMDFVWARKKCE